MTKEQLLTLQNKADNQIALAAHTDIDGIRGTKEKSAKYTQYEPTENILFSPNLGMFNLFAVNPIKPLYNSYQSMEYIIDNGNGVATELQEGECPATSGGNAEISTIIPMGSMGNATPITYESLRNKLHPNSRNRTEDAKGLVNTLIGQTVNPVLLGINNKLWNGVAPTGTYTHPISGAGSKKRYSVVGLLAQHKAINNSTTPSDFSYGTVNYPNTTVGIASFVDSVYDKHIDAVTRRNVTKAILLVPKGGSNVDGLNEELELKFGNNINWNISIESFANRQTLLEAIQNGNLFSLFPTRSAGFKTSDFMIVECDQMTATESYYYPVEVNGEATTQHHAFYLGDSDTQTPIKLALAVSNESYFSEFPELGSVMQGFDRVYNLACRTLELSSMWQGIFQFKAVGLGKYWNDVNIFPTSGGLALPNYQSGNMTNTTGVV